MFWTHLYDLIFKLISFAMVLAVVLSISFFEEKNIAVALIIAVLYFLVYNYVFRTFASYLYCRLTLKMNVTLNQAKQLNNAFSPLFPINLQWLPMRELRNMDDAVKYQVALHLYNEWIEERRLYWINITQDFKNSSSGTKLLTFTMYGFVVYFMLAGILNWQPVLFLGRVYCIIFYSNTYPPFLIGIICSALTVLLFKAIDKNIKL